MVRNFLAVTCFLLGGVILSSCGSELPLSETETVNLASSPIVTEKSEMNDSEPGWRIEMLVTGGFAGIRRSIQVASTGEVVVRDLDSNKLVDLELDQSDLESIGTQVISITQLPSAENQSCNDCFIYELDITLEGKQLSSSFNDEDLFNSDIVSLVNELMGIINSALDN